MPKADSAHDAPINHRIHAARSSSVVEAQDDDIPAGAAPARTPAEPNTMPSRELSGREFLNVAGHELRAPVTALKGQLQLMQRRVRREGNRERDDEALTKMLYQVERMQQLVAVYLDATYLARGDLNLLPQPSDALQAMARVVSLYSTASPKHVVRLETAETALPGTFDVGRFDLIVRELLGNALKFSQEGEIVVRMARSEGAPKDARKDGREIIMGEVEDQGPLIPAHLAAHIFEAYVTGPDQHNTGLGLGLYVAREIARLHGGDMGLRKGDHGNVFWFTLAIDRPLD